MGNSMDVEFEPEYMMQFRTYMQVQDTMSLALYAIESLKSGKVPSDIRKKVIKSLESMKGGLEYHRKGEKFPTYLSAYLRSLYRGKQSFDIAANMDLTIKAVEENRPLDKETSDKLVSFYTVALDKMTTSSRELEEKMFGRIRSSRTYS